MLGQQGNVFTERQLGEFFEQWLRSRLVASSTLRLDRESIENRLIGEIDVDALNRSVRYLVRRHEILRTTYTVTTRPTNSSLS